MSHPVSWAASRTFCPRLPMDLIGHIVGGLKLLSGDKCNPAQHFTVPRGQIGQDIDRAPGPHRLWRH